MNIQEALDRIDMMRPNMMQKHFKIAALSELDGRIWEEIILKHWPKEGEPESFAGYSVETDPGTEMLAPFPYDEIYTYWLASKVDWQNQEMDKYGNDRILFNNAWQELDDYWTRTHMPKTRVREFRL